MNREFQSSMLILKEKCPFYIVPPAAVFYFYIVSYIAFLQEVFWVSHTVLLVVYGR